MFEFDTKNVIRGVAVAAGLALSGLASSAAATELLTLSNVAMDGRYRAYITDPEKWTNGVEAYSNIMAFTVTNTQNVTYDIYGFCIDIYHDIGLGGMGLTYESTYGGTTQSLFTNYSAISPSNQLNAAQIDSISALVDTGWILHRDHVADADTSLKLAAIQAAIWYVANPLATINVRTDNLSTVHTALYADGEQQAYLDAFNSYKTLTGPSDRVYTITDVTGDHQTFAIGWPIDAPEPGTWALMLVGFGGLGSMLRRRRAMALAA